MSTAKSDSESDASDCGAVGLKFNSGGSDSVSHYDLSVPAIRRRPMRYFS